MRLREYADMHCHILPGVDDGSDSMEESLAMLKRLYAQGVRDVILTPHFAAGGKNPGREKLEDAFAGLKKVCGEILPDMLLYMGNELLYQDGTTECLKNGEAYTMAGSRYVLVEFGVRMAYNRIERAVAGLIAKGYRPIIAHMERYESLYKQEERIKDLIKAGAYLQMNADSVTGGVLNKRASYCRKLVSRGYIHFISTDAHDLRERPPELHQAMERLSKICDERRLGELFGGNARKVIDNQYI